MEEDLDNKINTKTSANILISGGLFYKFTYTQIIKVWQNRIKNSNIDINELI